MLTPSDVTALMPDLAVPPVPTGERYRGAGHDVTLADLHADDQDFLRRIYQRLDSFYQTWRTDPGDPPWLDLADRVSGLADPEVREEAQAFGIRTRTGRDLSEHMQRVLHDVRGGGLSAALAEAEILLMRLPAVEDRARERRTLKDLVYLARDHAKMMRNAVRDIDPVARARDTQERPHYVEDLIRRWDGRAYRVGERTARVRAAADRNGALSSCCLEASAVDRVLYNLIGNAARAAADKNVTVAVEHVSDGVVRVSVANRVTNEQSRWLADVLEGDPGRLYRDGVTRGGQGHGLANVAHFVTAAFHLGGADEAVKQSVLGSRIEDHIFLTWFHWPAFDGSS